MNKDKDREKLFKELTERNASDIEMAWNGFVKLYDQPDRLRRVDTSNSEAIVGSANIDEIAELNRND